MRKAVGAAVLAVALASGPAFAQSKTGTAIGQFLGIEPSARIAAMGNAGVSIYDGIQSVYYNPAALGPLDRPALQFTHSNWYADISYDYAAGVLPLRQWGALFGSVTTLNSGEIDVRTVDQPLGTGERYTVSDVALSLGYGREITSRFAAGIQVNYINETIWHSSLNAFTLSVGTLYRVSEDGLRIGSSLSNLGTRTAFDGRDLAIQYDNDPSQNGDNSSLPGKRLTDEFPVPILFRVGMSLPRQLSPDSRLLFAVDAFHPSDNSESLSGGAEWSWKDTVALRAGYQSLFQEDSDVGLALGLGLRGNLGANSFQFDYAWADHSRLQETHRMTFAVTF
jgi:long-subunit fatty acid transport protein